LTDPIVIVGAGAAGLMAAIAAAQKSSGPGVVLLERTADGGRKILISGGGRCNILPFLLAPERFVTDSPAHLMRGLLRSWPLVQQREFFERDVGIALALEAETGKLFPRSNRARDVRDGLAALARERGAELSFGTTVSRIERAKSHWTIDTNRGPLQASRVVLATGGCRCRRPAATAWGCARRRVLATSCTTRTPRSRRSQPTAHRTSR
jgi:predicted flavoprotein YhiN